MNKQLLLCPWVTSKLLVINVRHANVIDEQALLFHVLSGHLSIGSNACLDYLIGDFVYFF